MGSYQVQAKLEHSTFAVEPSLNIYYSTKLSSFTALNVITWRGFENTKYKRIQKLKERVETDKRKEKGEKEERRRRRNNNRRFGVTDDFCGQFAASSTWCNPYLVIFLLPCLLLFFPSNPLVLDLKKIQSVYAEKKTVRTVHSFKNRAVLFFFFFSLLACPPCPLRVGAMSEKRIKRKKEKTPLGFWSPTSLIDISVRHVLDTSTLPKMACRCNLDKTSTLGRQNGTFLDVTIESLHLQRFCK